MDCFLYFGFIFLRSALNCDAINAASFFTGSSMELLCERHRPLPPLALLCTACSRARELFKASVRQLYSGLCHPVRPSICFCVSASASQDGLQVKLIWINFSFVLGEVLFLVVTDSGCGAVLSVSTMCHWSNCCSAATVRTPSRNSGKNSSRRQEAVCGRACLLACSQHVQGKTSSRKRGQSGPRSLRQHL